MIADPEILPCPFCGSSDVAIESGDNGKQWWVECRCCDAEGPLSELSELVAAASWNDVSRKLNARG